jgi:streptogramin lyase
VTSAASALLYRLDPTQAELCTFALPSGGKSIYVLSDTGDLWLGDRVNGRLLRLKTSDNSLTWWSLPADSSPFGMALDGQGHLWYADPGRNVLAQLDHGANQLASYALPRGTIPTMIAVQLQQIWYTEQYLTSLGLLDLRPRRFPQKQRQVAGLPPTGIGRLDPQTAGHTDFTPTVGSATLAPSCARIDPTGSGYLTITTADVDWVAGAFPTALDENGWSIYQLPGGSLPWGIAASDQNVWMVDSGRKVLARVSASTSSHQVYLPLVRKE